MCATKSENLPARAPTAGALCMQLVWRLPQRNHALSGVCACATSLGRIASRITIQRERVTSAQKEPGTTRHCQKDLCRLQIEHCTLQGADRGRPGVDARTAEGWHSAAGARQRAQQAGKSRGMLQGLRCARMQPTGSLVDTNTRARRTPDRLIGQGGEAAPQS